MPIPTRRDLLTRSVGLLATPLLAPTLLAPAVRAAGFLDAERLRLGVVGVGGRGHANLAAVAREHVVALCDVDSRSLDRAAGSHPDATRYRDWRRLLAAERLDAVVVSTPDHTHAPITAAALRRGLHVYTEKPLARSVHEVRELMRLARQAGVATQMGTQIHAGSNYRRVVEIIQAGLIGPVREVHVWCNKAWADGRFGPAVPVPEHLDWDLWLGPATQRPYCEGIHPGNWRRYWDYGTGTLGDMACHYLDLVHWALDLRGPTRVSAEGPPLHATGSPSWLEVRLSYPRRGSAPPVEVTWYDGHRSPDILAELRRTDGSPLAWGDGQLFVGERGMLISDYSRHRLLPQQDFADVELPEQTIPDSIGHHAEWLAACRTGQPTTCDFAYAGPLTEAVLLGAVAYRAGGALQYYFGTGHAEGPDGVQALMAPTYRKGWRL